MNVVLIGEEAAGMRASQSLEQCGVRVVGVMASPRRDDAAGMSLLVATLGHTTWPIELIKDPKFAAQVRDEKVDVILNAHSLFLIRKEMSEAPRLGSFNLHPVPPTVRCTARRGWHGEEWRRRDCRRMDPGAAGVSGRNTRSDSRSAQGWGPVGRCVNTPASKP